jgi:uncharacterized repeat protein (TIGR02543 family)
MAMKPVTGKSIFLGCLVICLLFTLLGCHTEPQIYSVTFHTNGGSTVTAQSVQESGKATRPAVNPTKPGYSFDNWYAESTFNTVWNFNTPITGNKTLYAKWIANEYTLSFHANGGTGSITSLTLHTDEGVVLPENTFTREDCSFAGWATSPTGSIICTNQANYIMGTTDTILYAKWKVTRAQLDALIFRGDDVTTLDTSGITNMTGLFNGEESFNQDISGWDVSNVTTMRYMFLGATVFNQDISGWDVSNVTDMTCMFQAASTFNQNLSDWDVSSVTSMHSMFMSSSSFNGDISDWDVSNVTDMRYVFMGTLVFNQDISEWDVSNITDMTGMFASTSAFNQDISSWDVSNATVMYGMFSNAAVFNQDISPWNVGNVTDMSYMFYNANSFNENISSWNVLNVTDMSYMFASASAFNQDISS